MVRDMFRGPVEARFLIYKVYKIHGHKHSFTVHLGVRMFKTLNDKKLALPPVKSFQCGWLDYLNYKQLIQKYGALEATISYYPYKNLLHSIKDVKSVPKHKVVI